MTRCPKCGAQQHRSTPQLRRYMALIRAAYHHWPERHRFRPVNETHLRKWLQCRAGHYTVKRLDLPPLVAPVAAKLWLESAFRVANSFLFASADEDGIDVVVPKSVDYRRLGHKDACRLFDEVEAIIETELGVEAGRLLKETEKAA